MDDDRSGRCPACPMQPATLSFHPEPLSESRPPASKKTPPPFGDGAGEPVTTIRGVHEGGGAPRTAVTASPGAYFLLVGTFGFAAR